MVVLLEYSYTFLYDLCFLFIDKREVVAIDLYLHFMIKILHCPCPLPLSLSVSIFRFLYFSIIMPYSLGLVNYHVSSASSQLNTVCCRSLDIVTGTIAAISIGVTFWQDAGALLQSYGDSI